MVTTRTPLRRPSRRHPPITVTPEALRLRRACKAIRNKNSDAFKAAERALQQACGLSKFGATPTGRGALIAGDDTTSEMQARRWRDALERADREA